MNEDEATQQLCDAVATNDVRRARESLAGRANPNSADEWQQTPLHVAAHYGYMELVRLLIEHGAELNAASNQQITPLHLAARKGHVEIARFLIDQGANPDAKDSRGRAPRDYAIAAHSDPMVGFLESAARLTSHAGRVTQARDADEQRQR